MATNHGMTWNDGRRETVSGDGIRKCCGNCRYCEKSAGENRFRCRRHKIETYFAGQCGECELDWVTEG